MRVYHYALFICLFFGSMTKDAFALKVIEVENSLGLRENWYNKNKSNEENFKRLVSALNKTATGKKVIDKATTKAAQYGMTLYDVLDVGEGSLTDTTLIRRFSASNPNQVMYETRSKVYLSRHLKTLEALLDFSHELTHFTYREAFNPYNDKFKLNDFIKSTVEGRGGEVDAYLVECKVLQELLPTEGFNRSNCSRVFDMESKTLSKKLGVIEFYKIGRHYEDFKKEVTKYSLAEIDAHDISSQDAVFISSAWGLPYPVAAIKEYVNIMDRVCHNDQNRLALLQEKVGRSPAQESLMDAQTRDFRVMFEDFRNRCDKFLSK